jgi:MraZ protein
VTTVLQGFVGTHTPRMDDKGRITLPAKYRDEFATGVFVARGQDHCLYVFNPTGFADFSRAPLAASINDPRARAYQRMLLANTDEQKLDGQGRIAISPRMRDYAHLGKDVIVAGVGDRLEIWDAQEWAAYEALHEDTYANPDREVFGLQ